MMFLVVDGLSEVMDIFLPMMLFIRVDFPTFGLPINPTNPLFMYWFILISLFHQMGMDIIRLLLVLFGCLVYP